jgi:hypothetical protein
MTNSQTALQVQTIETATKHGETWTTAELQFVAEFPNETAAELARTLGRTLYAIQSIREAIKQGKKASDSRRKAIKGGHRWIAVDDLV